MITERDLDEAIAECHGVRNPNADVCIKLASFYTIKDHMNKSEPSAPSYSFSSSPSSGSDVVMINSGTEFSSIVDGKSVNEVMAVMDELMSALQIINPRLYKSVLGKL